MEILEKVAYMKGLAEGLGLDTKTKEGKLLTVMIDILDDIALELQDLFENQVELEEGLDAVSDDLSDVETYIYEMVGEYDEDEDDEEYEFDEDSDTLSYNGVVYNEMKGAYSSPDEIGSLALLKALYPDSIYSRDAGGNPDHIPELTYDMLKETHEKHYHPSGAKIILDGRMELDKILALIDSHLERYERSEPVTLEGNVKPIIAPVSQVRYEISAKEEKEGRSRVLFGYVYSGFEDKLSQMTAGIFAVWQRRKG